MSIIYILRLLVKYCFILKLSGSYLGENIDRKVQTRRTNFLILKNQIKTINDIS